MECVKIFVDPGIIATNKKEKCKELIEQFISFKIEINKIENLLLESGNIKKIIQIPFENKIFDKCLEYFPSIDDFYTRTFYREIYTFFQKNIIECSNNKKITNNNKIFLNSNLPKEIITDFNEFLLKCCFLRQNDNICKLKVPEIAQIYISENSDIKSLKYNKLLNPNDIKREFPILNFYPKSSDSLEEKEKKFRKLIDFEFYKIGLEPKKQYELKSKYLQNEFFDTNRKDIQKKILEIIVNLLKDPKSLKFNREKYLHEKVKMKNRSYSLESCYLFRTIEINGVIFTPRILFTIVGNKIFFWDIINRH